MLTLDQQSTEVYCREKRYERYEKYGGRIRFLRLHSFAHRILIPLMKAELFLTGRRMVILRDERKI